MSFEWATIGATEVLVMRMSRPFAAKPAAYWVMTYRTLTVLTCSGFEMPKKHNSPGPEGILPILLKKLAEEIGYPRTNIFRTSLEPERLPRDCLTVNKWSIYKRDQRQIR